MGQIAESRSDQKNSQWWQHFASKWFQNIGKATEKTNPQKAGARETARLFKKFGILRKLGVSITTIESNRERKQSDNISAGFCGGALLGASRQAAANRGSTRFCESISRKKLDPPPRKNHRKCHLKINRIAPRPPIGRIYHRYFLEDDSCGNRLSIILVVELCRLANIPFADVLRQNQQLAERHPIPKLVAMLGVTSEMSRNWPRTSPRWDRSGGSSLCIWRPLQSLPIGKRSEASCLGLSSRCLNPADAGIAEALHGSEMQD
jgi:hypothetical protein